MKAFNRAFTVFVALLWIAAAAGVLYMMWANRVIDVDNAHARVLLDFSLGGSDRVLAALIVLAAMLPALALLGFEARAVRPRRQTAEDAAVPPSEDRYRELRQRIDELQRKMDDRATGRSAAATSEPVMAVSTPGRGEPRRRWSLLSRERS